MTRTSTYIVLTCCLMVAAACGGGDSPCDPVAQSGCDDGLVCEAVTGGEPACYSPVVVRGNVFDLADDSAVPDAHVVALDVNGAALSSVAVSDINGNYQLAIPSERNADGVPVGLELTLRADASTYQPFPSGLRQAIPVDTATAVDVDGTLVVASSLTDIGLISLPSGSGAGTIYGTVAMPADSRGVLVVAETSAGSGSATGYTGVADFGGNYTIFNVPDGTYEVTAYARGVTYEVVDASVSAGGDVEANIALSDALPGTVTGTVQIVNAFGGASTSVILAIESTFDDVVGRGQTVPGLRAPNPGIAGNIVGEYTLDGVPPGDYVVLGAFENDRLVRDPDESIGGTSTLHITVTSGQTTTVDGFKITEALDVIGPGANGPEMVTGFPTLSWKDDSSEDSYDVVVFDAFGTVVWETTIPGESGSDPTVVYAGPALVPGMYYQFKATSKSNSGSPLSTTEDLKGVFFAP